MARAAIAAHSHEREPVRYDLLSPAFYANPHPTLRRMQAEEPVYWHPELEAWILTGYDDIQSALKDPRLSVGRTEQYGKGTPEHLREKFAMYNRLLGEMLAFNDPPKHTPLRGLVMKAFAPQGIDSLRSFVQSVIDERLDAVLHTGRMDVVADLAVPVPGLVIGKVLGMPVEDLPQFKQWTTDVFVLLGAGLATEEAVEAGYRGAKALREYCLELIARRRKDPQDDLITRLIAAEEQGRFMSEEELVATCVLIVIGGHETTTNLIGNGTLALLKNPDQLRKLREEPALINNAVEEVFRYNGPTLSTMRKVLVDLEIGGKHLRAGQFLFCMLHAANRDPTRFVDPERFDISRADLRHLGLGHGIHFCLGAALARLEGRLALQSLVQRLPDLALATREVQWAPSIAFRAPLALPVTFTPPRST
jgi:hypothetical protein